MFYELSNLSESACISIQNALEDKIVVAYNNNIETAKTIAGVDLAYWREDKEYAVCCIVILNIETLDVIEEVHTFGVVELPYIPGCLAFRELPLVLGAVKNIKTPVDIYMFDGNGILHPRKMGLAAQASIYLNRPTLGVAKSYYKIDNIQYKMPDDFEGAYTDITRGNEILGRAIRTQQSVKPVFVSVGNWMDINQATDLVLKTTGRESHIPIPTRLADLETHKLRSLYQTQLKK